MSPWFTQIHIIFIITHTCSHSKKQRHINKYSHGFISAVLSLQEAHSKEASCLKHQYKNDPPNETGQVKRCLRELRSWSWFCIYG